MGTVEAEDLSVLTNLYVISSYVRQTGVQQRAGLIPKIAMLCGMEQTTSTRRFACTTWAEQAKARAFRTPATLPITMTLSSPLTSARPLEEWKEFWAVDKAQSAASSSSGDGFGFFAYAWSLSYLFSALVACGVVGACVRSKREQCRAGRLGRASGPFTPWGAQEEKRLY